MAKIERVELQAWSTFRPRSSAPTRSRASSARRRRSSPSPTADGAVGTGYSYTIGTGGSSVMRLLADHLAPRLIGKRCRPDRGDLARARIRHPRHDHRRDHGARARRRSTPRSGICAAKKQGLPLWNAGRRRQGPLPALHHRGRLAAYRRAGAGRRRARRARAKGFTGSKVKIGRPHGVRGLCAGSPAVREAVGADYEIMTDANQGFALDEAIRRAGTLRRPRPRLDRGAAAGRRHRRPRAAVARRPRRRSRSANRSIRSGISANICRRAPARSCRSTSARIGGITPWLKVAHAAEAFDMPVCPHFLMELHVSLACAVQNGKYVEYIPQLDDLTTSRLRIEKGMALAPSAPGIGVEWDWTRSRRRASPSSPQTIGGKR